MEKIDKLKKIFEREKIDGYIIPKNDEFFGEYTPDYNDRLNFISGFTGSYGFALVLKNKNYLFVDGRYTLQAKRESGKNFKIIEFPKLLPKNTLSVFFVNSFGSNPIDKLLFFKISFGIFFGKVKTLKNFPL